MIEFVVPTLRTDRLTLRGFEAADVDQFTEMWADPMVTEYLGGPIGAVEAWRRLAVHIGHWVLEGYGRWAITEQRDGRLVGWSGVLRVEAYPQPEVGWVLRRDCWGRGYATEAAAAALRWAVQDRGLANLISVIHPDNQASIAVAQRLGARYWCREPDTDGIEQLLYRHDVDRWR
jgi:RimJ/RimL family protein N-acetyltransferase